MIRSVETDRTTEDRAMGDMGRSADYYNALLRNLRLDGSSDGSGGVKAIGVSSAEGCSRASVVATNLAICMAKATAEGEVVLINANPSNRVPEVNFSLRGREGIYEVIHGTTPLEMAITGTSTPNLSAIGCGQRGHEGMSISCLERFRSVLSDLKQRFARIIVDLPVATELTTCFDMAAQLDGVVVAVESSRVSREVAKLTVESLRFVNAAVLGCVFLDTDV